MKGLILDSTRMKYLLSEFNDCTDAEDFVGIYSPDGLLNVTFLFDEDVFTGLYAKNGSINIVEGSGQGVYSKCGALNVHIPDLEPEDPDPEDPEDPETEG